MTNRFESGDINISGHIERHENPPVIMTQAEFDWARNADPDDLNLISFMNEKGIAFDRGDIDILVGDQPLRITTAKHDFGTVVDRRDAA